jgi:hypothetical protein
MSKCGTEDEVPDSVDSNVNDVSWSELLNVHHHFIEEVWVKWDTSRIPIVLDVEEQLVAWTNVELVSDDVSKVSEIVVLTDLEGNELDLIIEFD